VFVDLHNLAFGVHLAGCEHAGAVQINPLIEVFLVKNIDRLCMLLRNVCIAHMLPDNAGIFALRKGVIVALA